jgi:hypothetical protein
MTTIRTLFGSLVAVVAAVVGVVVFGAAQASASSEPIVISYEKTCVGLVCAGTAGNGGTITMRVTSFRETGGGGAQLTLTEDIEVGNISFTAVMRGHRSPAGFIVLNGRVTAGSFAGAQVHQRSNLVGDSQGATDWTGALRVMPASA